MTYGELKKAIEAAYLAGFNASGKGYNGEYPFQDNGKPPEQYAAWLRDRDNYVSQAIAEESSATQEPVALSEDEEFEKWFQQFRRDTWIASGCHIDRGQEPSAHWSEGLRYHLKKGWDARANATHPQPKEE